MDIIREYSESEIAESISGEVNTKFSVNTTFDIEKSPEGYLIDIVMKNLTSIFDSKDFDDYVDETRKVVQQYSGLRVRYKLIEE